jgi:hypothetical protein
MVEKASPNTSIATNLPPEILIRICSFNALPDIWSRYVQVVDDDSEEVSEDGEASEDGEEASEDGEEASEDEEELAEDTICHESGNDGETIDDDNHTSSTHNSHIRDTINASHVCRTWRTILLSAPELWCRMVDPYNPSVSKIMLERSKPLGIAFSLPPEKEEQARNEEDFEREMLPEYVNRLTEYQFRCNFFLDAGPQSHYLCGSMNARYFPMLEDLSIGFPSYSELPHKFPGKGMPKLRRLHLLQCFFPVVFNGGKNPRAPPHRQYITY